MTVAFTRALQSTDNPYPIAFDEAWQWIGFSTKGNAKRVLDKNFEEGADYLVFINSDKNPQGGRSTHEIHLTTDCFKSFCMLAQTEQGKAVRRYFLEIEKRYLAGKQLWDESIAPIRRAVEHYLSETNDRIAEIEQNVSAKLSLINDEYYSLSGYYALRRQRWNLNEQQARQTGHDLRRLSRELGYDVLKAPHSKFGQVNTYHHYVLRVKLGF